MTRSGRPGILVLGMHRSGTSAVTRLLGLAGGGLPLDPMPPTADNPRGYWESRRIARFNNRLLESAGTRWSDPAAIPESWFDAPARAADAAEAASLLAAEFPRENLLICKDPRICRLLPLWQRGLALAGVVPQAVVVMRDPHDVAASLAARAADPVFQAASVAAPARGLVLWLRYILEAERHSRGMPRRFVDYARVLADWRTALDPVFEAGFVSRPDPAAALRIDTFLEPGLRHHHADAEATERSGPPAADVWLGICASVEEAIAGVAAAQARCDRILSALDHALAEESARTSPVDARAAFDPIADAVVARLGRKLRPRGGRHPVARRAVFLSGVPQSIGHIYRVEHAVAALRAHGWQAEWRPLNDPGALAAIGEAAVVTVFRAPWGDPLAAVHAHCRERGIPVVFDVDDLLFDPQVTAAGCIALLEGCGEDERRSWLERTKAFRRAAAAAVAAVLTTAPLADAARRLCPHAVILPNALSPGMEAAARAARLAPRPSLADDRPRLLFASGTPTHHRDFAVAAQATALLFARRPEPLLVVVGHLQLDAYPELKPFRDRIEVRPRVPFADLFTEVARGDVNLCPLELDNPFCESKSEVRWLAAAAIGLPTVASPTVPLRAVIKPGETGLLAATATEWAAALEQLVADAVWRARLGEAARREALARFGFDVWSERAARIYAEIVDRGPATALTQAPPPFRQEAPDG